MEDKNYCATCKHPTECERCPFRMAGPIQYLDRLLDIQKQLKECMQIVDAMIEKEIE